MEAIKSNIIAILCIICIVIFTLHKCSESDNKPKVIDTIIYKEGKIDTIIKYDTLLTYIRGKGKIQWLPIYIDTGTNKTVEPFISSLDTCIKKDSFKISYSYPINEFTLNVKRYDSTIYIKQVDTLHISKMEITEKTNWIYVIGGSVIGLIVGTQLK